MVSEKELVNYIENLPVEFFIEKWDYGVSKEGLNKMIVYFGSFDNVCQESRDRRIFFSSRLVSYDLEIIKRYRDLYEEVSKEDFEMYFGKTLYNDIKEAIERQTGGVEAYIK